MTADAERFREETMAEEWLAERVEREIARLSAVYEPPWHDATAGDNQQISEETGS